MVEAERAVARCGLIFGNGVATLVVARWCGQLDQETLRKQAKTDFKFSQQ